MDIEIGNQNVTHMNIGAACYVNFIVLEKIIFTVISDIAIGNGNIIWVSLGYWKILVTGILYGYLENYACIISNHMTTIQGNDKFKGLYIYIYN